MTAAICNASLGPLSTTMLRRAGAAAAFLLYIRPHGQAPCNDLWFWTRRQVTDETLALFDEATAGDNSDADNGLEAVEVDPRTPLAERLRPRSLHDVVGQERLAGPDGVLRRMLSAGHLPSLVLHGPPGCGKTTLARVIASETDARFVPVSAVSEGVPRLRQVVREAEMHRERGRRTVLFLDEIHRLNKGQQDFLLPFVESGLLTLVGATTEHPAFEINAALLSRMRVLVLEPLADQPLHEVLKRALDNEERGLGGTGLTVDPDAAALLVSGAAGDARQLLGALETAAELAGRRGVITEALARTALQRAVPRYDTTQAYQMLSAFHKSLRASDGDAALYWAARMLRGGENPLVLFRRLVAAAYEDVGLADPRAGMVATQAMQAFERLGTPEGLLPLANGILYVAHAPKSNRAYLALGAATAAADEHGEEPVPLPLRNASTDLMKAWGYGDEYRYAHHYEEGYTDLQCLPDSLSNARFYEPTDHEFEAEIGRRMRARGQGQ